MENEETDPLFEVEAIGSIDKLVVEDTAEVYVGIAIDVSPTQVRQAIVVVAYNRGAGTQPVVYAMLEDQPATDRNTALARIDATVGGHIHHLRGRSTKAPDFTAFINGEHALAVRHLLEDRGVSCIEWHDYAYRDVISIDECANAAEDMISELVACGTSADWERVKSELKRVFEVPPGFRWGGLSRYTWGADDFTDPNKVREYHGWYIGAMAFSAALAPGAKDA